MIQLPTWLSLPSLFREYRHKNGPLYLSTFGETILAAVLSALALIAADALNRTDPIIAMCFRAIAGGIALIWLIRRCCALIPPVPHRSHLAQVPRCYQFPYLSLHDFSEFANICFANPIPTKNQGFPSIHRIPAQPHLTPIHQAPVQNGGFNLLNILPNTPAIASVQVGKFPRVHWAPAQPNLIPILSAPLVSFATSTQSQGSSDANTTPALLALGCLAVSGIMYAIYYIFDRYYFKANQVNAQSEETNIPIPL